MSDSVLNNVRELRRQKEGMTQKKLAELTGVSRQTIISIEAHRYTPSLALAFKIAKVFETDIENIFRIDEQDSESNK